MGFFYSKNKRVTTDYLLVWITKTFAVNFVAPLFNGQTDVLAPGQKVRSSTAEMIIIKSKDTHLNVSGDISWYR